MRRIMQHANVLEDAAGCNAGLDVEKVSCIASMWQRVLRIISCPNVCMAEGYLIKQHEHRSNCDDWCRCKQHAEMPITPAAVAQSALREGRSSASR